MNLRLWIPVLIATNIVQAAVLVAFSIAKPPITLPPENAPGSRDPTVLNTNRVSVVPAAADPAGPEIPASGNPSYTGLFELQRIHAAAERDPLGVIQATLADLPAVPDGLMGIRRSLFERAVSFLSPETIPKALSLLEARGMDEAKIPAHFLQAFMRSWGRNDATTAWQYVQTQLHGKEATDSVLAILEVVSLPPTISQAADLAVGLPAHRRGELWQMLVARQLANQAPVDVAKSVIGLTDGEERHRALEHLIHQWSEFDLPGTADWVATVPAPHDLTPAARIIAERWSSTDPAAAFAWLSSLPNFESRSQIQADVMRDWSRVAPTEAGEFLLSIDRIPDEVLGAYSETIAASTPRIAIELAQLIENSNLRNQILAQIESEEH